MAKAEGNARPVDLASRSEVGSGDNRRMMAVGVISAAVPAMITALADAMLRSCMSTSDQPAWITEWLSGEILTTATAGEICDVTPQAISERCRGAEDEGRPIGVRVASTWLVSRRLLLDRIGEVDGVPARLAAESRAEKIVSKLSQTKAGSLKSVSNFRDRK